MLADPTLTPTPPDYVTPALPAPDFDLASVVPPTPPVAPAPPSPSALGGAAARWWSERLLVDGKRQAFRAALEPRFEALAAATPDDGGWSVGVDFDPNGVLAGALADVGLEYTESVVDLDGPLPVRTGMVYADGVVLVSTGEKAPWEPLDL